MQRNEGILTIGNSSIDEAESGVKLLTIDSLSRENSHIKTKSAPSGVFSDVSKDETQDINKDEIGTGSDSPSRVPSRESFMSASAFLSSASLSEWPDNKTPSASTFNNRQLMAELQASKQEIEKQKSLIAEQAAIITATHAELEKTAAKFKELQTIAESLQSQLVSQPVMKVLNDAPERVRIDVEDKITEEKRYEFELDSSGYIPIVICCDIDKSWFFRIDETSPTNNERIKFFEDILHKKNYIVLPPSLAISAQITQMKGFVVGVAQYIVEQKDEKKNNTCPTLSDKNGKRYKIASWTPIKLTASRDRIEGVTLVFSEPVEIKKVPNSLQDIQTEISTVIARLKVEQDAIIYQQQTNPSNKLMTLLQNKEVDLKNQKIVFWRKFLKLIEARQGNTKTIGELVTDLAVDCALKEEKFTLQEQDGTSKDVGFKWKNVQAGLFGSRTFNLIKDLGFDQEAFNDKLKARVGQ